MRRIIIEKFPITKIDLRNVNIAEVHDGNESYESPASTALELGAIAMNFAHVNRAPQYDHERRENDAEHSYMLALVANELAVQLYPDLKAGLVSQYAIVHDLIETVTGDVATFQLNAEELAAKQQTEHAALGTLLNSLPPYTAKLLLEYETQQIPEARFVKAVDKLLPVIVDILGDGQNVMKQTYGITTSDALRANHQQLHTRIAHSFAEFPPLINAHGLLCELFQHEFEIANTDATVLQ
jgi:5'-deoxynucleotidase YfbR-like HD superfamily hydrolase